MAISPHTPLKSDEVVVRVGCMGLDIKGRGKVKLWPMIHIVHPRNSDIGKMSDGRGMAIPKNLEIVWHDSEKVPNKNLRKQKKGTGEKLWLHLYEQGAAEPWIRYKTSREDKDTFEALRRKWGGSWYLRNEVQDPTGNRIADAMVTVQGSVTGTEILRRGFPEGADTLDRNGMIQRMFEQYQTAMNRLLQEARDSGDQKTIDELNVDIGQVKAREASERFTAIMEDLGGPLPWVIEEERPESYYEIKKNDHQVIVENYLKTLNATRSSMATSPSTVGKNIIASDLLRRDAFSLFRNAHIFEIPYHAYQEIYTTADIYTTEQVAGFKFQPSNGNKSIPEEETAEHIKRITEAGTTSPFPEKLPFDVCWFAIGRGGLSLSKAQMAVRGDRTDNGICFLIAIVIASNGMVIEVLHHYSNDSSGAPILLCHRVGDEGGKVGNEWLIPYSMMPWIVNYLVESVNDHHTTIINGEINFSERRLYETLSKKIGIAKPIPAPFYRVIMRDVNIKNSIRRVNRKHKYKWSYSHRFTRKGHYALKVERGPLPMPKAMRDLLERRGRYMVFDKPGPIGDQTVLDILRERKVLPKSHLEWMAVKQFWRKDTIVGDESLPFVPSTRIGTKGVLGLRDTPGIRQEAEKRNDGGKDGEDARTEGDERLKRKG